MSLGGFRLGGFNLGATAWPNLGVPGFSGLLDQFAGAAAAYSLRKLSNSTGDVVRVRESGGDTERDFNATEVTDGTLEAFCGANDGFVVTWYDQSGNSRNATQATTSAQPQIVSSGSLVTGGLDFNGTSHYLQANAVASALSGNDNFIDSFVVAKNERISGASAHYALGNNTNPSPQLHYSGSNDTSYRAISRDDSNVISLVDVGTFNAKSIVSVSDDGDTIDIRADGTSIGSDADAKTQRTFDRFAIGALDRQGSVGGYFDGEIEEVILYPSDQSGNLAAIEANLNAYYGIY